MCFFEVVLKLFYSQNNCIGEKNTRYFMAFLLWHFLICLYGTVAIGLVLAGRLRELRVVDILTGNIDLQLISIFGLSFFTNFDTFLSLS